MSDSSKWKKQKRSPRPPRHMTRGTPGSELPASNGTTLSSNLTGECSGLLLVITSAEIKNPSPLGDFDIWFLSAESKKEKLQSDPMVTT